MQECGERTGSGRLLDEVKSVKGKKTRTIWPGPQPPRLDVGAVYGADAPGPVSGAAWRRFVLWSSTSGETVNTSERQVRRGFDRVERPRVGKRPRAPVQRLRCNRVRDL